MIVIFIFLEEENKKRYFKDFEIGKATFLSMQNLDL
jgi:hypothetical protein